MLGLGKRSSRLNILVAVATPTIVHPNSLAKYTAVVPLPDATSKRRLAGFRPSMCPSCRVSSIPPGWSESPSRKRAKSLSYSVAQHCLTCCCPPSTRIGLSRLDMNHRLESMATSDDEGSHGCFTLNSMGWGTNL